MAIKFSQFVVETSASTMSHIVGYDGADNIQITPNNFFTSFVTGTTGQVPFFGSTTSLLGDTGFNWDNTNKRLGVGITSPIAKLHVYQNNSDDDTTAGVTIEQDGTGDAALSFLLSTVRRWRLGIDNNDFDKFKISSSTNLSTNNKLTIDVNGNVGIGTTSPGTTLDVVGTLASSGITQLGTGGSNVLLTSSGGGNVGIGNSSPGAKLDVQGDGAEFFIRSLDHSVARIIPRGQTGANIDKGLLSLFDTGTEDVRIDTAGNSWFNGGNVGIGTSSPSIKLNVVGTGTQLGTSGYYHNTFLKDDTNSGVLLGGNNTSNGVGFLAGINELAFLTFGSSWGERMRINSSGNVGIGTSSPDEKLVVNGNIKVGTSFSSQKNIYFGDSNFSIRTENNYTASNLDNLRFAVADNADAGFRFTNVNDDELLYIKSENGNVGIGTTAPESKLTIKGDPGNTNQPVRITNTTSDTHTGLFLNGTGNAVGEKYGMQFGGYNQYSIGGIFGVLDSTGASTSGDITFDFGNGTAAGALIERMRVTHEGKVGIGTTAPLANLDVANTAGSTYQQWSYDNPGAGNYYLNLSETVTAGNVRFCFNQRNAGVNYNNALVFNQGNIGIGTDEPSSKLDVDTGRIQISSSGTKQLSFGTDATIEFGSDSNVQVRRSGSSLQFKTGGSEVMRIDSAGNVGIGTTAPTKELDVRDEARIWNGINGTEFSYSTTNTSGIISSANTSGNLEFRTNIGAAAKMFITNAGNTGIGTVTPTAKLQVVGLAEHADNTAAISAGLTTGAFYRTGDLLKVVH